MELDGGWLATFFTLLLPSFTSSAPLTPQCTTDSSPSVARTRDTLPLCAVPVQSPLLAGVSMVGSQVAQVTSTEMGPLS